MKKEDLLLLRFLYCFLRSVTLSYLASHFSVSVSSLSRMLSGEQEIPFLVSPSLQKLCGLVLDSTNRILIGDEVYTALVFEVVDGDLFRRVFSRELRSSAPSSAWYYVPVEDEYFTKPHLLMKRGRYYSLATFNALREKDQEWIDEKIESLPKYTEGVYLKEKAQTPLSFIVRSALAPEFDMVLIPDPLVPDLEDALRSLLRSFVSLVKFYEEQDRERKKKEE